MILLRGLMILWLKKNNNTKTLHSRNIKNNAAITRKHLSVHLSSIIGMLLVRALKLEADCGYSIPLISAIKFS